MSHLALFFLGQPEIHIDHSPVPLPIRKAVALTAYLSMTGKPQSRESLVGLLWPELSQTRGRASLRHALWTLGSAGLADWLENEGETVGLKPGYELDVARFQESFSRTQTHQHPMEGPCSECLDVLGQAAALYRGDFLAGFTLHDSSNFDDWQFYQAESQRQALASVLEQLIRLLSAAGAWDQAIAHARRWVSLDVLHEPAHRELMQLYARAGKRGLAMKQYEILRQTLNRELGVEPEEESLKLFQDLVKVKGRSQENDHPNHPTSPMPENRPRHNLPAQLTSFIGREKEIAAIEKLMQSSGCHLLTLTGSGGVGKTRLALQAARQMLAHFAHGAWLVELAPLTDPVPVPRTVANALGLPEQPGQDIRQTLIAYLKPRHILLLLDNCEHVIEEVASLTSDLLHGCPQLRILATSREILGVPGEMPFRCPSMTLPDEKPGQDLATLAQSDAVQLFLERVRPIWHDFLLSEENAVPVGQICRRLDGVPLAIELAAARTRMFSLEQIASRLDDSFHLLTGGGRSVVPRHQTLRASIDWSYNLLSPAERTLLRRLSVFTGGWTLEAAESVCSDSEKRDSSVFSAAAPVCAYPKESSDLLLQEEIDDLLGQLIDKSLIQFEHSQEEEPRYRMLETVRQYTHDRLAENGRLDQVHEQHLNYFLSLALQAEPHLRTKESKRWLDRLEQELDNIRLALKWSLSGSIKKGLRLASALLWLWHLRGHRMEGLEWLDKLLAAEKDQLDGQPRDRESMVARGKALNAISQMAGRLDIDAVSQQAGSLESRIGILQRVKEFSQESKAIFMELSEPYRVDYNLSLLNLAETEQDFLECRNVFLAIRDSFLTAECDQILFGHAMMKNELEKAIFYTEENLALRKEIGDLDGEGFSLVVLAMLSVFNGMQLYQAFELAKEGLACYENIGNREFTAFCQGTLAYLALIQGDSPLAIYHNQVEYSIGQEINSPLLLFQSLTLYAYIAWARQDFALAVQYCTEAFALSKDFPLSLKKPALYVFARVALSQGDYDRARNSLVRVIRYCIEAKTIWDSFIWPPEFRAIQALGVLAAAEQQMHRAAVLFGAQEALFGWMKNALVPPERSELGQAMAKVRAALSDDEFITGWEAGRAMTAEQAIQFALEGIDEEAVLSE